MACFKAPGQMVDIKCPVCAHVFPTDHSDWSEQCPKCLHHFSLPPEKAAEPQPTFVMHTIYPQGLSGKHVGPFAMCAIQIVRVPEPRYVLRRIVGWSATRAKATAMLGYHRRKERRGLEYQAIEAPFTIWVERSQWFAGKDFNRLNAYTQTLSRIIVGAERLLAAGIHWDDAYSDNYALDIDERARDLKAAIEALKKLG